MKRRYTLHVCFSAGNMVKVAASLSSGFVVADNDASGTGERVAKEIGWPFWMSDTTGEDADDALKRCGLFKFSQSLVKSMGSL
jgi:putative DNA primase/helicase